MDLLVRLQRAEKLEALAAHLTAVAPLPGVSGLVAGEGPDVVEGLTADVAEVLVSPRVHFAVRPELRLQTERLGAEVTLVRFVRHVDPAVDAQAGHVREGFVANVACERPVSRVQSGVAVEAGDGEERLAAVRTVEGFLVLFKMSLQLLRRWETLSAHSTDTLRVFRVTPGVFDQAAQHPVPDSTDFTGRFALLHNKGFGPSPHRLLHLWRPQLRIWLPLVVPATRLALHLALSGIVSFSRLRVLLLLRR